MKNLFKAVLAIALLSACNNGTASKDKGTNAPGGTTQIKFETDAFDFGKIYTGDKVTHGFKFTNTGKAPLIITNSTATCGCTTPEWPHNPIVPGGSGLIKVTFNSAGKSGLQDKQITITANTSPTNTVVHLVGEVLDKK